MWVKHLKVFILIALTLTLVNWLLGSLIVRDKLPAWVMLLANPPFGRVYIWTESLWQGHSYQLDGQTIREGLVMRWQLGAHLGQIFLYYGAWSAWEWHRRNPAQRQGYDQDGRRRRLQQEDG